MSKRRIPFLVADIVLIALAVYLSFFLRFEGQIPPAHVANIWGAVVTTLLFCLPAFYYFKLYSFSWAYVSTEELVSLVRAQTFGFLLLSAAIFIFRSLPIFFGFPRSVLFISFVLIFLFCGGLRFIKRFYLQMFGRNDQEKRERTLIAGAGGAGEQILRNILNSKNSPYLPIGFVDDDPGKIGLLIHGLKVLGKIDDIPAIAKKYEIDNLLIAFPSAGSEIIKRAEKKAIEGGIIDVKYLPPMDELINSADKVGIGVLRDIDMEDLLGRRITEIDQKPIQEFIRGKIVLITGAAGSIGSELSRQVAKFNPSTLFLLDQDETGIFNISQELKNNFSGLHYSPIVADICDFVKINRFIADTRPDIIFHAAAYKHVPLMEDDPREAVKNNVLGTYILTKAFKNISDQGGGVKKFIFISTDKAVNPTSVMGATKRLGEMICQMRNQESKNAKFISVRFGNVLGSRGSVIPIFREQISKGGPVKITHKDMKRYFMVTSEACLLVMRAGAMGSGGEAFVLDMGSPVRIIDLAKELIKLSGLENVKIIDDSGIRPGEKLTEEILTAEEGTFATKDQKIFVTKISQIDQKRVDSGITNLIEAIDKLDKKSIINQIMSLVPSYKPSDYILNHK